jgi:hypothetical protein
MPITVETMERTGGVPEGVEVGDWIPDSKDVLVEKDDARLYLLSDRLTWDAMTPVRAFSIGDVLIVVGLAIFLVSLAIPRFDEDDDLIVPS